MHELSFAEQILARVEREMQQHPGCKVTRIKMRAGELLLIDPASLRFCLEGISVGTVMEGAAVDIAEAGPELDCPTCGRQMTAGWDEPVCPRCGGPAELVPGAELVIEEIELDEKDPQA